MTQFPLWQRLLPAERAALSEAERDRLYAEYVESCRGSSWGNLRETTQGSNFNNKGWGRN
jgi:hypothetical protein